MRWNRLTKPRFILAYLFTGWCFLVASTSELQMRIGIPFLLLGVLVRLWANGYVGHVKVNWTQKWRNDPKVGRLVTGGPYAHVRHPLYFGSFLLAIGFCVIAGSVPFALAALGCFVAVYRRKLLQEEQILLEEWGDAYARYQHAVPRYVPSWRRYPEAEGTWSWAGIWASKEPKTLAWVCVFVILFYFREELVQNREGLTGGHRFKHVILLAIGGALLLIDGLFEIVTRRRRRNARPLVSAGREAAP
ncbi:MAG: isoprenylcysteine carboxylmethyltransferase family protein [Candidatus Omnitrophica bacterium]|nr:isoprenylcysteine carboxylmethyltransferase family protein [Candidatus Omnitrophota bacterium]